MSAVIKGNQLITWGAGAAAGLGIVQSASTELGGEEVELLDEDGEVFCVIFFNDKDECEFEALMQSSVTPPERGDSINIGGVVGAFVKRVKLIWANKEAQKISIQATKYRNL